MHLKSLLVVALVVAWSGRATAQSAQDSSRAAARELGYSGVDSYQAGDYAAASAKLEKAYSVLKVPSLGLWSARALVKLDRWVEAAERLRQVQTLAPKGGDAPVQQQAIHDAKSELDALLPRIPRLVITLASQPEGEVELSIDGEPISSALLGEEITVNPGAHTVFARAGALRGSEQVTLAVGPKRQVRLHLSPSDGAQAGAAAGATPTLAEQPRGAPATNSTNVPGKPADTRRIAAFTLIGVGAAGVILGATTGIIAVNKKSQLEHSGSCKGTQCLPDQTDAVSSYGAFRTISGVSLIAGAALATTGVVVLVTALSPAEQVGGGSLWLRVSTHGAAIAGTFQ